MACHHLSTEGLKVLLLAVFLQQSRGFALAGHFERGQQSQLLFGVQGQCFFPNPCSNSVFFSWIQSTDTAHFYFEHESSEFSACTVQPSRGLVSPLG